MIPIVSEMNGKGLSSLSSGPCLSTGDARRFVSSRGESVKAVVVLRDGENVTGEEIIEWCKDKMASYKKPKSIDVIPLEEMPLMGGGYKVLRRELRDRYRKQYQEQKQGKVESWGAV